MKTFEVQTVELDVPRDEAFAFIAEPSNLPRWARAFARVSGERARLKTPDGEVDIGLHVSASHATGTVDWYLRFPDGAVGRAYSRLVDNGTRTLYSFTLTAPPVPLEALEGALEQQSETLRGELETLKQVLEYRYTH